MALETVRSKAKSVFGPRQWAWQHHAHSRIFRPEFVVGLFDLRRRSTNAIRFWAVRGNGALISVASSFEACLYELLNLPKNERPAVSESLKGARGMSHAASTKVSA